MLIVVLLLKLGAAARGGVHWRMIVVRPRACNRCPAELDFLSIQLRCARVTGLKWAQRQRP